MPITLATLPHATAQEVFDQSAKHLLAQNEKSEGDDGQSKYRLGKAKCAAGFFISDKEYLSKMEGKSWRTLVNAGLVPLKHMDVITGLQNIHDDSQPEEWLEGLRSVALTFGLQFNTRWKDQS